VTDPLRRVNNVGRSCFRFKELQHVCSDALLSLSSSIVRSEYGATDFLMNQIRITLALPLDLDTEPEDSLRKKEGEIRESGYN
jgi:hypothetical protein